MDKKMILVVALILGMILLWCNCSRFTPVGVMPVYDSQKSKVEGVEFVTNGVISAPSSTEKPNATTDSDSRYKYGKLAPVNPMMEKFVLKKSIPASPDLYYDQTYDSKYTMVDAPPIEGTNQLYYSGGNAQMLEFPLQFNVPNENEQLRSQQVLITPYNRIKYSTEKPQLDVY